MQAVALVVAAAFALVGVLGFIPGVTTDYDRMEFAGHESGAQLFGLFDTSVLHNLVHLAFAAAGLVLARTWNGARAFLIGGGLVYLAVAAYGALTDRHEDANFVPLNNADDWLHLGLGVVMIALGLALAQSAQRGADREGPPVGLT